MLHVSFWKHAIHIYGLPLYKKKKFKALFCATTQKPTEKQLPISQQQLKMTTYLSDISSCVHQILSFFLAVHCSQKTCQINWIITVKSRLNAPIFITLKKITLARLACLCLCLWWPLLKVNALSKWIIGIYLHEFTNNEREISIPHEAAEYGIEISRSLR